MTLQQDIARQLFTRKLQGLTDADLTTLWNSLAPAQRARILAAIKAGDEKLAGRDLVREGRNLAQSLATARSTAILGDGVADLAELGEILS
jgi:hypothetical protein